MSRFSLGDLLPRVQGPCRFVYATPSGEGPKLALPSYAFWGRSNVGKSTMINKVTGQKDLARTSKTPGRTQQLNFFQWGDVLYLVDLPGYGYAKAPKEVVEAWSRAIDFYFRNDKNLQCVFMLIDGRHGIKPNDQEALHYVHSLGITTHILETKIE